MVETPSEETSDSCSSDLHFPTRFSRVAQQVHKNKNNYNNDDDTKSLTLSKDDSTLQQNDSSHHSSLLPCQDKDNNDVPFSTRKGQESIPFTATLAKNETKYDDNNDATSVHSTDTAKYSSIGPLVAQESPLQQERHVSFHIIEIQEYAIIPGDNPAVTMGVPLTIDWEPLHKVLCMVDDYEVSRPSPPRSMVELKIPTVRRYQMLRSLQFTRQEILRHAKLATVARNRRKRTHATMHLEPIKEIIERWCKALANATWNRVKKEKEKEWMKRYPNQHGDRDIIKTSTTRNNTKIAAGEGSSGSETETLSSPTHPACYESKVSVTTASSTTSGRSFKGHDNKMEASIKNVKMPQALEMKHSQAAEQRLRRRQRKGPKIPNSIKKKQRGEQRLLHRRKMLA
jgi:hypothetical protein